MGIAVCALLHGCGGGETIDLTAQLDRAEVRRETQVIDIGTPAARPHLAAGWGVEEKWYDATFAWSLGTTSTVEFFVASQRGIRLTMRGFPPPFAGLPEQAVRVSLNDKRLREIVLQPGEHEYELVLPMKHVRPGTNRLQLAYRWTCRPIDLDPTSNDPRQLAAAWDWLHFDGLQDGDGAEAVRDAGSAALRLPPAGEVSMYLDVPAGARLEIERITATGEGAAVPLQIDAQRDDGVALPPTLFDVAGELGPQRWMLDGSGPTRFRFRTLDPTRRITLRAPRVSLPPSTTPVARCADTPSRADQPLPVIVYLVDTLRADHLGCYGYPLPTTPRIDAFSRDAVRFANAVGQSSWTKPSVASLFTGLTPKRHGAARPLDPLRAVPTLAGLLGGAGYQTAALITNSVAGPHTGLEQGFASFEILAEMPVAARPGLAAQPNDLDHQNAAELNRRAFDWLDQRRPAPFLLYLHASDPHAPYLPAEPFRQQFAPDVDLSRGLNSHLHAITAGRVMPTAQEPRDLMALYDADIAFTDREFGVLLDGLKQRGLYDSALIIFVADHGEAFDEHQRWEHATSLYAEQLDVPLLIKFPNQWRAGSVVTEVAQHADVLPTILAVAGVDTPGNLTGRNLLPEIGCPTVPHPEVVAYSYLEGIDASPQIEALIIGRHKLIHHERVDRSQRRVELYALDEDPGERRDLSDALPITSGYLLSRMAPFRVAPTDAPAAPPRTLDPAVTERLRALGYVP